MIQNQFQLNYLYFHNGTIKGDDGTVLDANDNSYRYSGGDFQLTEKATISGLTTLDSSSNTTTNGVINFYCNGTRQYVGYYCDSSYTSYYTLQYDVTFTQYSTYKAAIKKAIYDGYIKNHVNNFVCFGYDTSDGSCPTDNLYRIIGVFENQVKLIKYDYATSALLGTDGDYCGNYVAYDDLGSVDVGLSRGENSKNEIGVYYWNYNTKTTNWAESNLNIINLNTNYLLKPFPQASLALLITINAFLSICVAISFIFTISLLEPTQNNIIFLSCLNIPFAYIPSTTSINFFTYFIGNFFILR